MDTVQVGVSGLCEVLIAGDQPPVRVGEDVGGTGVSCLNGNMDTVNPCYNDLGPVLIKRFK